MSLYNPQIWSKDLNMQQEKKATVMLFSCRNMWLSFQFWCNYSRILLLWLLSTQLASDLELQSPPLIVFWPWRVQTINDKVTGTGHFQWKLVGLQTASGMNDRHDAQFELASLSTIAISVLLFCSSVAHSVNVILKVRGLKDRLLYHGIN